MKRQIAAVAAVVIVLVSLAACGGVETVLEGTWKATIDYDTIVQAMGLFDSSFDELTQKVDVPTTMSCIFKFQKQNYTCVLDRNEMKNFLTDFINRVIDAMDEEFIEKNVGVAVEKLDSYKNSMKVYLQTQIGVIMEQMSDEELIGFPSSGTFTYEGGKITLNGDDSMVITIAFHETYFHVLGDTNGAFLTGSEFVKR